MALIRITNPNELRGAHIVLLAVILLALAGCCLLTSAGKPAVLPDGAVEWHPDSLLLALVEILDLQYAQPTPNGVAIKGLVHGAASGVALLIAALGLIAWARAETQHSAIDTVYEAAPAASLSSGGPQPLARRQLNPVRTAQGLWLAFLLWSFASVYWSDAPAYAHGGACLIAIQSFWAFALAFGLNRRAAVLAGHLLVAVLTATAALAIAYHAQRNPTLRASYPVGNPIFLASCLLPGIVVALVTLVMGAVGAVRGAAKRGLLSASFAAAALVLLVWAFWLTRSRGPALGLMLALVMLSGCIVPRRWRKPFIIGAIGGIVLLSAYLLSQRFAASATGRSASMRLRLYTWPYAFDLFQQHPLRGWGQGAFCMKGDALAIPDVENDPGPLEDWIANAHNEWLEIAAELGSVGLVLVMAVLLLTILGAVQALPRLPTRCHQAMTVALSAALVGIIAAECFGVALRFEGLPLIYFTLVGLLWALAKPEPTALLGALGRHRALQVIGALAALALCVFAVETSRRDFAAARAAYDVPQAINTGDFEAAESRATQAFTDRIVPQRKLIAHRLLAESRLHIARHLQEKYLQRLALAQQAGGIDAQARSEADVSRHACETLLDAGETVLVDLQAVAPTVPRLGRIAADFRQLRMTFAEVDGDASAFALHRQAAAHALRTEIARRPFDTDLAARYVILDLGRIPTAEAFSLLARPLRHERPESLYVDALNLILASAPEAQSLFALFDRLVDAPPPPDPAEWPDRWAPELLRLGALASYAEPDYARALRYLNSALAYYELLGPEATLARAACIAELAEVQFYADPENPQAALATAQRAMDAAPQSENGRLLVEQLAARQIDYHLAAGDEDSARMILAARAPGITDPEIDRELANRYVRIAYRLLDTGQARFPEKIAQWSERALALAPEFAPSWFLVGDIALRRGDAKRTQEAARSALEYGGDPESVLALLERACAALPDSAPLKEMRDQLQTQLYGAPAPPDAVAPPAAGAPPEAPALSTNGPAAVASTPDAASNGL